VFLPYPPRKGRALPFGASSNGLASGNTVREATLHGLCELLERDIRSFQALRDTSSRIDLDSIEGPAAALVRAAREAGLELSVRSAGSVFGVPYFVAVLYDAEACSPHLVNAGFGCHPHRGVALVRAIAEAAQSRLSYIHGGRDDLYARHSRVARWSFAKRRAHVRRVAAREAAGPAIPLEAVPDLAARAPTLEACEALVLERLDAAGIHDVYRVVLSRARDELHVVRVVVPRLEVFTDSLARVGPRLAEAGRLAKRA
jgi:ribosomal protein S12 methylthiotransferase accessory factor